MSESPALFRHLRKAAGVFALLLVLVPAGRLLFEAAFYPWARSFGLWPVLVGSWQGEMRGASGASPVFLEIESTFFFASSTRHLTPIDGRLRWCDEGTIRDYDIDGNVDDWRGTRFTLAVYGTGGRESGQSPDRLAAEWRDDTIEATGTLWRQGGTAAAEAARGAARGEEAPRVRYSLRRGTEDDFLAACGGSRARGR